MIDEDVLRDLLADAAAVHEPPVHGRSVILTAARSEPAPAAAPRRWQRPRTLVAAVLLVVVAAGGLVALQADESSRTMSDVSSAGDGFEDESGGAYAVSGGSDGSGGAGSAGAGGGQDAGGEPAPPAASRVVKTGALVVEVDEGGFERAVDRLASLAVGAGGFVAETKTFDSEDVPSGSVTLRVPSGDFEQVLSEIRKLGDVQSVTTSARDVTAEYTDLEARLRALTATRDQLLALLGRSTTIPDVLAVQDRLTGVQVQIEQLQGQQQVLDDQTTFGTLKVSVSEPGSPGGDDRSGLAEAWDDARDGFTGGVEWLVARSGTALLIGLLALAVLAVSRTAWPAFRRRLL